ncbi:hypothetical protein CPB86DRAFT_710298, partial [Serendipita vermifera]
PCAQYIAPEAPIWARYLDEAELEDKELIDPWSGSLDALLIFAGLFAAILTALLVESRKELAEDPQERLLKDILRTLRNASDSVDPLPFQPESMFVNINGLWFSSLTLTLSSALGGVLAKGWISKYSSASLRKTSSDACSRMLRSTRIRQWGLGGIITSISLLIQIALWLFFIGLGYLLWETPNEIKYVVLTLVSATALLYVIATLLPMVFPACPLQTPLTIWQRGATDNVSSNQSSTDGTPRGKVLRYFRMLQDLIQSWTKRMKDLSGSPSEAELQARVIAWTIANTFKKDTFKEAIKALAGIQNTSSLAEAFHEFGAGTALNQKLSQYFKISPGSAIVDGEDWFEVILYVFLNGMLSGVFDNGQALFTENGLLNQWKQLSREDHRALASYIWLHHLVNCREHDPNLGSEPKILAQNVAESHANIEGALALTALRGVSEGRVNIRRVCIRFLGDLASRGELQKSL